MPLGSRRAAASGFELLSAELAAHAPDLTAHPVEPSACSLGLAGMVIDGAIRDVAEIVSALFLSTRGVTSKNGPGAINVPVAVGGMPGDIIVGDQDALLAFPPSLAATVIKARAQEQKEHGTIHAIREGRWDRAFVDALEDRCAN